MIREGLGDQALALRGGGLRRDFLGGGALCVRFPLPLSLLFLALAALGGFPLLARRCDGGPFRPAGLNFGVVLPGLRLLQKGGLGVLRGLSARGEIDVCLHIVSSGSERTRARSVRAS